MAVVTFVGLAAVVVLAGLVGLVYFLVGSRGDTAKEANLQAAGNGMAPKVEVRAQGSGDD